MDLSMSELKSDLVSKCLRRSLAAWSSIILYSTRWCQEASSSSRFSVSMHRIKAGYKIDILAFFKFFTSAIKFSVINPSGSCRGWYCVWGATGILDTFDTSGKLGGDRERGFWYSS